MTNFIFKKQILGKVIKVFRGDFKTLSVRGRVVFILDRLLIVLVLGFLIYDLYTVLDAISTNISYYYNDSICWMSNNVPGNSNSGVGQVNTQITHSDNSISNTIRSLFIYGTGGYRVYLQRGGTPGSRFLIVGGALATDAISRVLTNVINDPTYLANQANGLRAVFAENGQVLPGVAQTTAVQGSGLDRDIIRIAHAQAQEAAQAHASAQAQQVAHAQAAAQQAAAQGSASQNTTGGN